MGSEEIDTGNDLCFECLENTINLDFPTPRGHEATEELVPPLFCYGISSPDTVIPYGNSAVIQIANNGGTSARFNLIRHQNSASSPHPLSSYIDSSLGNLDDCDSKVARSSALWSRRTINALAPIARVSTSCCYSLLQELASEYSSGCLEDNVLRGLSLGLQVDESSSNVLLRHPNVSPILGFLKSSHSSSFYVLYPNTSLTLLSLLHYNPIVCLSPWRIAFLLFQLLSSLDFLHSVGVTHNNISSSNIMLTDTCWLWLPIFHQSSSNIHPSVCPCHGIYADLLLSPCLDWPSQFRRWWKGELSNFEYLLILNRLAGRRWGDNAFHIVMPWVIDFSVKPNVNSDLGWRDLTKSKWRLAKGDEQLDFTYDSSEIPHHLSDECLSDLAVCSYKARRLPLSILRLAVRSVYEPNEYPSSMQRLYQWTPDECIPEFYCDSRIFFSIHPDMNDLSVPSWASSPEDFIKMHRDALESIYVSSNIHHWIDITFGYKMSGEAAIAAKNVMLSSSELKTPRSVGRRQLFTQPHPSRQTILREYMASFCSSVGDTSCTDVENRTPLLSGVAYLQELEEACTFADNAIVFSQNVCSYPKTNSSVKDSLWGDLVQSMLECPEKLPGSLPLHDINVSNLLDQVASDTSNSMEYQELLLWKRKSNYLLIQSEDKAKDVFSVGCTLAELCLKRPLFDASTLSFYMDTGELPTLLEELPPTVRLIVEACIHREWRRRPTAKSILESPYFSSTLKLSYMFVAPLQLLAKDETRLQYAANACKRGILKGMGTYAAEMCIPYCLPLVMNPQTDLESELAYELLSELMKCITAQGVKKLLLPALQKILQVTGFSYLKILLLQRSFVQDLWNIVGKQSYLETLHLVVISILCSVAHKSLLVVASVLLISTSEELGVPITVNQTIVPLIHSFGRGLSSDGIDVLIRIGGLFGDTFIIKQLLPLLKRVVSSCINVSNINKAESLQSWCSLALVDCLTAMDGLVTFLSGEMVLKELIEDGVCLHVVVLLQKNLDILGLQAAASTLMAISQHIGAGLTASRILPQLKELFEELAFSYDSSVTFSSSDGCSKVSKSIIMGELQFESRVDLVLIYPFFASLLGIEKLRQGCATWLLLEQFLLRNYGWKWECAGESSRFAENIAVKRNLFTKAPTEHNPAKLLLNGVGWSIPQSQSSRSAKISSSRKQYDVAGQNLVNIHMSSLSSFPYHEPWFWFPTAADTWEGLDFASRAWSAKEHPWKIKAGVMYSLKAHHGALRSLSVSEDECVVYTAGVGPGFKGTVNKWELSRISCLTGYYGHEEVVNDICELSFNGRVASCDGTVHVWNSRTGKAISVFSEPPMESLRLPSPSSKLSSENSNVTNSKSLSNALFTDSYDGNVYTCMHYLGSSKMLITGTDNGSIRFIDVYQGQKLHLWKGEYLESAFPPLVSTICSTESGKLSGDTSSSWIAVGLSSGHCRLYDTRSGNIITSWKAHDGYVTKLASPDDHLLVSSSFDKTLRVWDLRRGSPPLQPIIFRGHADGISGFSIWGEDVISICRNKIGFSSLRKPLHDDGQQSITPQRLYFADQGTKNLSILTSIGILPFSRVFVVGTEDGYMRICC